MKVNVCVNGTFRYPQLIRHYDAAGALGTFYFAHRRATGARLGVAPERVRNVWWKEYALQALHRWGPEAAIGPGSLRLCDRWQADVIRHWRDCDAVEAVIGAVADRVIDHARTRGCRVLGHPVTSHPASVAEWVGRAHADLGLDPAEAAMPGHERRLAEIAGCDRLLVDSAAVARSFVRGGVSPEQIATITPGVDLCRFRPRPEGTTASVFRVLCIGTLTPRKGQHLLLRAWRSLRLPGAALTLIGARGRHAAAVTRGFEGTFEHHHHIGPEALRDFIVGAAVVVMPSVEDGFAQAPLEAMACGVPVIVTRNVGMADLVEEGVNGFVVPPFDADALAARIETLYRDRDHAAAMGVAAAATARRIGSWDAYAGRVLAQHRALLQSSAADRQEAT